MDSQARTAIFPRMGTQRKDGKTQLGVWLSPEERRSLAQTLDALGMKTFADLARQMVSAAEWPESRLNALSVLVSVAKGNYHDGRDEVLILRLRSGENQALEALARNDKMTREEIAYEQIRALVGADESTAAKEIGPLDIKAALSALKDEIASLKDARYKDLMKERLGIFNEALKGEGIEGEAHITRQFLAATTDALRSDPKGLELVERALNGWRESQGLYDRVYHGVPPEDDVHSVLKCLGELGDDVNARLNKSHGIDLHLIRRVWAKMLVDSSPSKNPRRNRGK